MKLSNKTCKPLIPSTEWKNLSNEQHTSKGSIINEEQHESLLQALVSAQNFKIQDLLENHFGLQDIFTRTMKGYLQ